MNEAPKQPAVLSFGAMLRQAFDPRRNFRSLLEPPPNRMLPLDGIRAFALLWVIAAHVIYFARQFVTYEEYMAMASSIEFFVLFRLTGPVDIFFGISGFLIGGIVIREVRKYGRVRLKRFFFRRFLRLLPPYLAAMALHALVYPDPNYHTAWTNLAFFNNYVPSYESYMIWSWTMPVEVHFLIAVPFLAWLLYRRPRWALPGMLGLIVLACALRLIGYEPDVSMDYFRASHTRFASFLPGMLAAHLVEYEGERLKRFFARKVVRKVAIASLVVFMLAMHLHNPALLMDESTFATVITIIEPILFVGAFMGLALVLAQANENGWLKRILSSKASYFGAQLTYSAYLLHGIVMVVYYDQFGSPTNLTEAWQVAPILFALVLPVALLGYLFVEWPVVVLRSLIASRRSALTEAQS